MVRQAKVVPSSCPISRTALIDDDIEVGLLVVWVLII